MISQTSLPQDSPAGQRYVSVYALHAGSIFLPDSDVFEDSIGKDGGLTVPSFAFLIDHEVHGKFMFDLGLRKVCVFFAVSPRYSFDAREGRERLPTSMGRDSDRAQGGLFKECRRSPAGRRRPT